MWKSFKNWMSTDKAGAITNGTAAVIWGILAASSELALVRYLGMTNAVLFAAVAGLKLSAHIDRPIIAMWRTTCDSQHRMILDLIAERYRRDEPADEAELETSPELEDDTRLS